MKIWREETFGPILPIVAFDTPDEAIRMANSTQYGLGGSVFSEDMEEARMYASRMETGSVNINDCLVTYAFPSLPFGGAKSSGVGYYHGEQGIRNFCRVKSMTEFKGMYSKEFFHYPVSARMKEAMEALLVLLYSQSMRARWRALPKTTGSRANSSAASGRNCEGNPSPHIAQEDVAKSPKALIIGHRKQESKEISP